MIRQTRASRPAPLLALALSLPAAALAQDLPLPRGFYIDAAVACAEASNATLSLLHKTGLNSARSDCSFTAMTTEGNGIFAYRETCTTIPDGDSYEGEGRIEVLGPERFRLFGDGWERAFRHCPQVALPEPWRDNDISDLLD
jgi:hypothetical protein